MSFPSLPLRATHSVVGTFLALAALPACGKGGATHPLTGDGGAEPISCPGVPDSGLLPFEIAGSGTVQGTGLSATFCNVGVAAYGQQTPIRLNLDSSTVATSSAVELPTNGVSATLTGFVDLSSLTAGTSTSADATLCGGLVFSYGVPATPASACALDGGSCPAGCSFTYTCPAQGQNQNGCCVPLANTYLYQATSGAGLGGGCPAAGQAALGSWTVTLTSASAVDAGYYGSGIYAPHGTLSATLVGTSGKADTVDLSFTF